MGIVVKRSLVFFFKAVAESESGFDVVAVAADFFLRRVMFVSMVRFVTTTSSAQTWRMISSRE